MVPRSPRYRTALPSTWKPDTSRVAVQDPPLPIGHATPVYVPLRTGFAGGAAGALPIARVGKGAMGGGPPGTSGASDESCVTPGGVPMATVGGCSPTLPEQSVRSSNVAADVLRLGGETRHCA